MDASVSETSSETTEYLIVGDPFFGRNRLRKQLKCDEDDVEEETSSLNFRVWSNLPDELLIHIFARLPVKDILRIRCLSKFWRSMITSSQFQQTFADAALVRVALLVSDIFDGTMFLTQEKQEECFRYSIARCPEVVLNTSIVATTGGLVCVIENEEFENEEFEFGSIRVFVMNQVTGVRRELPPPSVMTSLPTLARMDANTVGGGYTITFLYTDRRMFEVSSWEVYDSVQNTWSKDDAGAIAHLKDVEIFYMASWSFSEDVASFQKQTRAINAFNLCASGAYYDDEVYAANPFAQVHTGSGEFYKLCMREGRHGVWKLMCPNKWEMVCECLDLEGIWTCLRVMNDLVVLVLKLPYECPGGDSGTILKVFHMPTKTWHNFPEEEFVLQNWGTYVDRIFFEGPFLVEIKFDATP